MTLGQKQTFNGLVKSMLWGKGSKSEHDAVVLDTGNGQPMKLRVNGLNAFKDPALDALIGKHVQVDGIAGSGTSVLFVDSLSDIKVQLPLTVSKQQRPPRP